MEENDIERYLKESSKSYREAQAKNCARRNSLQKRTLGIETERKIAAAGFNREEKLLREQLKQMKIEKKKYSIIHELRDKDLHRVHIPEDPHVHELRIPTEPYPITLRPLGSPKGSPTSSRKNHSRLEDEGMKYARSKGRRVSKEFEDLHINTITGKLKQLNPIKRAIKEQLGITRSLTSLSHNSPGTHRRRTLSRKHSQNSDGSSPSLSGSSMDNIHWIGEPEATKSIRRNRKTVEEQEFITEYHKLSKYAPT